MARECVSNIFLARHEIWIVHPRFRLIKQDDYFWVTFDHFWSKCGILTNIGSTLITKFNQDKLVQFCETLCTKWKS